MHTSKSGSESAYTFIFICLGYPSNQGTSHVVSNPPPLLSTGGAHIESQNQYVPKGWNHSEHNVHRCTDHTSTDRMLENRASNSMYLKIETIVYIVCTSEQTTRIVTKDSVCRMRWADIQMRDLWYVLYSLFMFVCLRERKKDRCVVESRLDKTKSETYANHRKCMKKSKR